VVGPCGEEGDDVGEAVPAAVEVVEAFGQRGGRADRALAFAQDEARGGAQQGGGPDRAAADGDAVRDAAGAGNVSFGLTARGDDLAAAY
jgi:hypothetical protein